MKLMKIKLINWHMFHNSEITLKGNTLISGENASGKSTLMDAIYYVLSGGETKYFNKAANDLGKRDLEGYVRGKLGSERQMYLRNGNDVITYIVLEFEDEKKQSIILGAELDIMSNSKVRSNFFIINNYKINNEDFIKDDVIVDYRNFRNNLNAKKIQLDTLPNSNRERKRTIGKELFKLDNYSRYFDLLARAVAFRPITEVSSFVNSFLLDEDEINLENLRGEIRAYREIHNILLNEEKKIELLRPFVFKAEKYLENEEKKSYLDVLLIKSKSDRAMRTLNLKTNSKDKINDEEEKLKKDKEFEEERKIQYITEIKDLKNNEKYRALNEKKERLKLYEKKLQDAEEKLHHFENLVFDEQNKANKLDLKYHFKDFIRDKEYVKLMASLRNYKKEVEELKSQYYSENAAYQNELNINENKLQEKKVILNNLNKGINNYHQALNDLIMLAKESIRKYNPREKNLDVRPLCEYIEVEDETWRNALEGYLNTQKFNLIVEPKYYDVVAKAYSEYKEERKIYNFGVVNIDKLPKVKENSSSLSSIIEVKNKYARIYANYLLNEVICVNEVEELKKYATSITKDGMLYKNYVLRAINPKMYNIPFLGQASREKRIKIYQGEIEDIIIKNNELTQKINKNKELISYTNHRVDDVLSYENPWTNVDLYQNNIEVLNKEITFAEQDFGLLDISTKIEVAEKNKHICEDRIKQIQSEIDDNLKESGRLETEIESLENEIKNLKLEFDTKFALLNEKKYEIYNQKYLIKDKLDEGSINKDYDLAKNYNSSNYNYLIEIMRNYSNTYHPSLPPIIGNLDDFINEFYRLNNCGVVEYRQQAQDAYEKALQFFREDFLSKLHEKIENAQDMLKKLNKNLRLHPFGVDEEIYEFYFEGAKDNEFGNYYRIITSGQVMEAINLFSDVLNEKDQSLMNDLFNKISQETDSTEAEKELKRYLDYRNYMNYDIKIKNKYGDESYFSKINREKSGGETQTPFYIIIAACFNELMNKDSYKNKSTSIVLFDEAFNNMDEGRIQSLMEFYNNLNVQVLIVVPSNRAASLCQYMDTWVALIKKGTHILSKEISK